NFIVMDYGTGAIFGCPAHDQRDLDFANKYSLGATPVVCPPGQDASTFIITDTAYDGDGRMINSRFLDGMTIEEAKEEVARRLEHASRGNRPVGTRQVNFRLRDWGISRQRYWGCPIPVIHCERCGIVPVLLPLLYRRFITRAMRATGQIDLDEPFAGLFTQGMVVHETYQAANGEWVMPAEVKVEGAGAERRATLLATNEPVAIGPI